MTLKVTDNQCGLLS